MKFKAYLPHILLRPYIGILVENSDRTYAIRNEIAASTLWQTQTTIVQSFGIVVANGSFARIYSNDLSGGITGVWACGRLGTMAGNEFFGGIEMDNTGRACF
ncbi:MAG: hypothetical protein AAF741_00900 [Bacteroidota bacterium]